MTTGQSIWHCSFLGINENGVAEYSAPKEYKLYLNYLSINPASGYLATLQYGKDITKVWTMIANKLAFDGVFKEGDVLYIEGNKPKIDACNGDGANARVQVVLPFLKSITITLEKIKP